MMRLGTYLECIGSSLRVSAACQDGAREFAGRRSRLTGILSGVAKKLVRSDGCIGHVNDCTTIAQKSWQ
ncbi:hypothetical protein BHE74_00045230 [Ensete ventricosum]|nr:hypothetical protein BHE74_00045230 [Ensete ventricosum]RZR79132.1 hypothetical protein BHM03_00004763 [Ensete ventricosum]